MTTTVIRPLTRQIRRDMERHRRPRTFTQKVGNTINVLKTGFAYSCSRCPAPITSIDDACLANGHVSHRTCPTQTT